MERFFLNLKMERVWQREYANQLEARKDVTDYIVGFYNCVRRLHDEGLNPEAVAQHFDA
jgi:putative transposase